MERLIVLSAKNPNGVVLTKREYEDLLTTMDERDLQKHKWVEVTYWMDEEYIDQLIEDLKIDTEVF